MKLSTLYTVRFVAVAGFLFGLIGMAYSRADEPRGLVLAVLAVAVGVALVASVLDER